MTPVDKQAAFSIFPSIFRLLFLIILPCCLVLSGCISHGLPEPVSGFVLSDSRLNKVVTPDTVALLRSPEQESGKSQTLGNQYLLGFIPLTSTYFEHGKQQLVEEALIDLMAKEGFRVAEVSKEDLEELAASTPLHSIFEANTHELSTNAWDLLFIRKLTVSAEINLTFYNPTFTSTLLPVLSERVEISESSFLPQAQGPRISSFVEAALKKNLEQQVQQIMKRPRLRNSSSNAGQKFLAVDMPQAEFDISEVNGKVIAESYGFTSWPGYSKGQLLRMIQRGLGQGVPENLQHATFAGNRGPYPTGSMKLLETNVQRLELDQKREQLSLVLNWTLTDQRGTGSLQGSCVTSTSLNPELDGSWVFALEQAASRISETLFNREQSSHTVCQQ